eukprot:502495-Amphidinium_carterae.1
MVCAVIENQFLNPRRDDIEPLSSWYSHRPPTKQTIMAVVSLDFCTWHKLSMFCVEALMVGNGMESMIAGAGSQMALSLIAW